MHLYLKIKIFSSNNNYFIIIIIHFKIIKIIIKLRVIKNDLISLFIYLNVFILFSIFFESK